MTLVQIARTTVDNGSRYGPFGPVPVHQIAFVAFRERCTKQSVQQHSGVQIVQYRQCSTAHAMKSAHAIGLLDVVLDMNVRYIR